MKRTVQATFVLCIAALLLGVLTTPDVAAAESSQPNIIVFLVDDMGVMDTSVPFLTDENGTPKRYPLNDYYRTPSMERLAEQGIRFNNFYAMSVCSPTRISIMTGQNAARHHATNWINPDKDNRGPFGPPEWNWKGLKKGDVTLPGLLRGAGYETIHVGKAHFGPTSVRRRRADESGFRYQRGGLFDRGTCQLLRHEELRARCRSDGPGVPCRIWRSITARRRF